MQLTFVSSSARPQNASMKYVPVGLGAMIREARLRRGMTQDELAERIGAVGSYVSQIETGARKWPQELIPAIADALKLDEVDMAIAAGILRPRHDRPIEPENPVLDELIDKLREIQLSEERADTLERVLDVWRDNDRKRTHLIEQEPAEDTIELSY